MLPLLLTLLLDGDPPAGGVRYAGLEIGGRGVKATVVEVLPSGVIRRLMSKTQPTKLTVLEDGKFRGVAIDQTAEAMSKYAKEIREMWKVPDERIHAVGSSGVPAASNVDDLKKAVKKATGKALVFINDRTEVELGIEGIIPKADRPKSISLDIGGGNTKGGYHTDGGKLAYVAVPYGSVSFADRIAAEVKKGTDPAEAAAKLREMELVAPLKKGAAAMPGLEKRTHVYLSGGMVWAMIAAVKPEALDRAYVPFTAADIDAFIARIKKHGGKLPLSLTDDIKDEKLRERARAELKTALKVYPPENLRAGAEILSALSESFALKGKTLIFPRNAAFGWITAYIAREKK
jgi:exopolyphosphatase/pppGpp-phosphohydrolase